MIITMIKRGGIFLMFLFMLVITINFGMAAEVKNTTAQNQASLCLNQSKSISVELANANFSTERINDTITQAEALYNEVITKKKTDFSLVIDSCDEIEKIKNLAYSARDELGALKKFYNESMTFEMNTTDIDNLISIIEQEIISERYEKIESLINQAYEQIINLKSSYTTLNILNKNMKMFFVRNWRQILITLAVIIIPILIFRTPISKYLIKNKIEALDTRKKTLKNLIRQTQRDYFEYGRVSEGMYNVKMKKFAELIRDIERQTPLLQEELIKLERKKSKLTIKYEKTKKKRSK